MCPFNVLLNLVKMCQCFIIIVTLVLTNCHFDFTLDMTHIVEYTLEYIYVTNTVKNNDEQLMVRREKNTLM